MRTRLILLGLGSGMTLAALTLPAAAADVTYPSIVPPVYSPASQVTGDVAIGAGLTAFPSESFIDLLASGRINVPFQGQWNLTGEIFGRAQIEGPPQTSTFGAAHLYHKTDQYAHGVFAAASAFTGGSEVGVGVEGAAFLDNTTLVGRLSYWWVEDGVLADRWDAMGIARYYVTPNTKLAALASWWSSPDNSWMVAGGAEHLFAGTNMTGFVRAARFSMGDDSWWRLVAGARFFFHRPGTTLQQHDWDIPFSEATVMNF